jgi:23S rRNA (guanosine2251-2'-O)-methyltransferase
MKRNKVNRSSNTTEVWIYGVHPVVEALTHARHAVRRIMLKGEHRDIESLAQGMPIRRITDEYVPQGVPRYAVHQGVFALVESARLTVDYKSWIAGLDITQHTALVLLDEITDPQNVGTIIRSSAAFGVTAVLLPSHRQAPVNGTVVKASAGTAFRVPLVSIGNINTTIRELKAKGYWIYGLDAQASHTVQEEQFTKPSVFVFGSEGRGVRVKTEELCDIMLAIPMDARCESLNVGSSAAVTLQAWYNQVHGKRA